MGLYESEINKQIHLRNRQRREWDMIKKRIASEEEEKRKEKTKEQHLVEQEQREEDRIEIEETRASKNLASSMVRSALAGESDTLQKVVDVLQNQNGNFGYNI